MPTRKRPLLVKADDLPQISACTQELPQGGVILGFFAFKVVEVVGIEPTSASPLPKGLHAYSVFNLTTSYPTGREDSQPAQLGFNGLDTEQALAAVPCR